jgi:hypothetical protein
MLVGEGALRKDGQYAGASLWSGRENGGKIAPRRFAVNTGTGSRLEPCAYFLERG